MRDALKNVRFMKTVHKSNKENENERMNANNLSVSLRHIYTRGVVSNLFVGGGIAYVYGTKPEHPFLVSLIPCIFPSAFAGYVAYTHFPQVQKAIRECLHVPTPTPPASSQK